MDRIRLVLPTKEFEEQVLCYKREFKENRERMYGATGLSKAKNYEAWLTILSNNQNIETLREGLVESSTYLAVRIEDEKVVGMIDIKHRLNGYLLRFGGHIGYSVRKTERRKGYGSEMLGLALEQCKAMNIHEVLLTCDKDNLASASIMIRNGAVLEDEILEKGKVTQRYWILCTPLKQG